MGMALAMETDDAMVELRGKRLPDEPMSRHTSWRVGGPADLAYAPADLEDLSAFLAGGHARGPLVWVGLGSNLLVRDGGVRGTVILTHKGLGGLRDEGGRGLYAEAGVPCAKVARQAARRGWAGCEFLAGIPGTMGGALAMNAGAFGGETWEVVESVLTIDAEGRIRERPAADFEVGYRSVRGPEGEWFVAARLRLRPGYRGASETRIRSLLQHRARTQPIRIANAGSVFRNPEGDHAGRLIEAAGLKGVCEGNACVSDLHANFIINRGGCRAVDIERLIERIRQTVEEQHGVRLQAEVRIVGEAE
jgi:UDP-N-acetylmuramate dehydrogenase